MIEYPFGLDISEYQGVIKWPVIVSHIPTVHFIYIRGGQGISSWDARFQNNWLDAKDASKVRTDLGQDPLLRGTYWVPFPDLPAKDQAQMCLQAMRSDYGELPVAIDLELRYNASPTKIRDMIDEFDRWIYNYLNKSIIIYSTIAWIKQYLSPHLKPWEGLKQYRFWIAQWLNSGEEAPGRIDTLDGLPRENILFHQTACSPKPFGVSSKKLDYDRFLGTLDALHQLAKVPVIPSIEPSPDDKLNKLWNWYLEEHNA